jgi:hypothetical protein
VMGRTNAHSQPSLQGYPGQSILQQQRDVRLCPGLRCSLHDTVQSHSTLPFSRRKHQLYLCRRSTVYRDMRRILRWRHRLGPSGHFDLGRLHRAMRGKTRMHWSGLVIRRRSGTAAGHSQQQWRLLLQNLRVYTYSPETRWKPAGCGFFGWQFCACRQQFYCK